MTRHDEPLGICLIGCGGMGRRHIAGYAALHRAGLWAPHARLVAVLDQSPEAAEAAAGLAYELLGERPRIHADLAEVLADKEIRAIDLVTDPASHHAIAVPALRSGRHVLSEKPLGVTIRACDAMTEAAAESGTILATAENYRRGGANRLARAVVHAGLLGRIHAMEQLSLGGSDRVLITPWRHDKRTGSIALDMGVHLTDLIEFYLGPLESAYGQGMIAEPRRVAADGSIVRATGEDSLVALLRTESGVPVQLAYVPSGPGKSYGQRTIHGSAGSLVIPPDRSDGQVELYTADGVATGSELRKAIGSDAELDEVTIALLGPDGSGGGADFAAVDAGYLGVEIADFVAAVREGRPPEVDGEGGTRAVAGVLAILESSVAGRAVTLAEVLDGTTHAYQDDIDDALGLSSESSESRSG